MPSKRKIVIDLPSDSDDEDIVVSFSKKAKKVASASEEEARQVSSSSSSEKIKQVQPISSSEEETQQVTSSLEKVQPDKSSDVGHVVSSTEATSEVPNGFFEFDDGTKISAPIGMTEEGQKILRWLLEEHKKRDPEIYCPQMLVKESFKGAGISEVFGNMFLDFNKLTWKKRISSLEKWAYVEGFVSFLKASEAQTWKMCDDCARIRDIMDMLGTIVLTCFKALSEKNLLAPNPPVNNIAIISLHLLQILSEFEDIGYEIGWQCEIIRLCDELGIDLTKTVQDTNEKLVKTDKIENWRTEHRRKETECSFAQNGSFGGNGYKYWAEPKNWHPSRNWDPLFDDKIWGLRRNWHPGSGWGRYTRKWFHWEWRTEFIEFKYKYVCWNGKNFIRKYDLTIKEVLDQALKG